jgi:hypothetical protein
MRKILQLAGLFTMGCLALGCHEKERPQFVSNDELLKIFSTDYKIRCVDTLITDTTSQIKTFHFQSPEKLQYGDGKYFSRFDFIIGDYKDHNSAMTSFKEYLTNYNYSFCYLHSNRIYALENGNLPRYETTSFIEQLNEITEKETGKYSLDEKVDMICKRTFYQ